MSRVYAECLSSLEAAWSGITNLEKTKLSNNVHDLKRSTGKD